MKNLNKLLALLLAVLMVTAMAACGNNPSGKDETQVTNPEDVVYNELNEEKIKKITKNNNNINNNNNYPMYNNKPHK